MPGDTSPRCLFAVPRGKPRGPPVYSELSMDWRRTKEDFFCAKLKNFFADCTPVVESESREAGAVEE